LQYEAALDYFSVTHMLVAFYSLLSTRIQIAPRLSFFFLSSPLLSPQTSTSGLSHCSLPSASLSHPSTLSVPTLTSSRGFVKLNSYKTCLSSKSRSAKLQVESLGQCTHSHLVVTPLLLNLLNVNPDKIQATTTNAMTMTIITITFPARGLLETFPTGSSVRTHTRPAHALAHPSESPNVVYAIVRTPSTISTLLIPDLTLKVMVNVGKEKTKCKSGLANLSQKRLTFFEINVEP